LIEHVSVLASTASQHGVVAARCRQHSVAEPWEPMAVTVPAAEAFGELVKAAALDAGIRGVR
jgi:hypothetical protein